MPKSKIFLPDINVWIAVWWEGHLHHAPAKLWFASVERAGAAFCRITQMGFLRLITNSRVMRADVVNQKHAWEIYEKIARDLRVIFLPEPERLESVWKGLTQSPFGATNVWTDAYLAAFASLHELALVSFDRSLARKDVPNSVLLH